ncbi:DinB family protein [Ulvibacter litoralis]|uniref:DinB family protein n=1 Tax=Ulvibacter litoralis TaxID=227084 RepID=UPI000B86BAC8|nr:DinB family protein [Ulvibacter litoralis]
MKKLLLITFFLFAVNSFAQQANAKDAFLVKWENSKDYLIAISEAMPEDNYSFKPTERQMSFKEQLIHIKGNMDWLSTSYFSEEEFKKEVSDIPATKKETIALVSNAFDFVSEIIKNTSEAELNETVSFFSGPKSKLQILNLLQDHVTHHRGQLIVYLNLNEIEPPQYVGW